MLQTYKPENISPEIFIIPENQSSYPRKQKQKKKKDAEKICCYIDFFWIFEKELADHIPQMYCYMGVSRFDDGVYQKTSLHLVA